jgi:hypothetical protein
MTASPAASRSPRRVTAADRAENARQDVDPKSARPQALCLIGTQTMSKHRGIVMRWGSCGRPLGNSYNLGQF